MPVTYKSAPTLADAVILLSIILGIIVLSLVASARGESQPLPGMLTCEATTYDASRDLLSVNCPPSHIFSPTRVVFQFSGSPVENREFVSVGSGAVVKVLCVEGSCMVRLAHVDGRKKRQWLAWRKFAKIASIQITQEGVH